MTTEWILTFLISTLFGGAFALVFHRWLAKRTIQAAQEEASDVLDELNEQIDLKNLEEQERIQEIETEYWTKVQGDLLKGEERIEELQEIAQEKKAKHDEITAEKRKLLQEAEQVLLQRENQIQNRQESLEKRRESLHQLNLEFRTKVADRLQISIDDFKNRMIEEDIHEAQRSAQSKADSLIEDAKEHAEIYAKRILAISIDRFARPYCPERGIGAVNFPDPQARKFLCDEKGENIKTLQEVTGCDIIVDPETDLVGVAGFDPVRRELTRRILEKLFKDRKPITPETIKKVNDQQKQELFRTIRSDGDLIARELKLEGLHPEIKQMMGSLRYRYSFTQNQYFHCSEVGWLAGLLASELNLEIRKARRCGMLHDIGKSMDHVMDGGHAMIGADFIEARNESVEVVHAVRAHHYDVTPQVELDFLVIAADAISGARPGARRSTIESYNQKVTELQDIARSFDGVTDCFVLSGGRECRIMVNSKKVDDVKALDLAKKIAKRIEEECNYPGQIKVVVVRETSAVESTTPKTHA